MQSLSTLKEESQASWNRLVEISKQQPEKRKVWGVTIAAAVIGGLALVAVSKGVLAVTGILAAPPVALPVGALAGGAVGWNLMQKRPDTAAPAAAIPTTELATEAIPA